MATTRFGYKEDLSLKNRKVGIGTSTANETLEVDGGIRGGGATVTGIATLTSYSGFDNTKFTNTENTNITGGESGTLSGEIVIGAGLTMSVGTGATSGQGNIKSLKVSNTFTPPIGGTNDRPSAPQQGALYYNKDFKTIEYWDGNFWRQVDNTTRSGRGVFAGRHAPTFLANIDYIQIPTLGNAVSFGDLTDEVQARAGGYSDGTRGVFCGGSKPGFTDDCDYITIPSAGNGIDFGNLTSARDFVASCSSSTRGITAGGRSGSPATAQNIIEYAEIKTLGNHIDFGDLSVATHIAATGSSPTRAVWAGGGNASDVTISMIQTVNFAAKGNAVKFGDLTVTLRPGSGGCSNSVRALFAGGYVPGGLKYDNIDVLNIASGGNATEGGDLSHKIYSPMAVSSQTRAVFAGGQDDSSPGKINNIQYVNISTLGNAVSFGDLTKPGRAGGTASDSHGGLGGF